MWSRPAGGSSVCSLEATGRNGGVIWSQELHSRETPPHYWPTVHESDQGFIEVYTVVQDVSGKAPHTSEHLYYLSVMENTPGGVSIIHIKAFDLHPSSNGVVKFTLRKLDAKQQEEHILEVMVTDGSSSAKSSVVQVVIWVLDENEMISTWLFIKVIETNNRRPQFSKAVYKITISANKLPRTEVLQLHTTDKSEKKKLRYILLSSTDPFTLKKFCLDSAKGLLYTAKGLDHDIRHRYSLTVMVHNQDFPAKCNLEGVDITVEDVRDNSFWFSTYTYTGPVFEATAVGSAVDKDRRPHAEILYYTESGTIKTMTLMKELDQNSKKQFDFGGKAKDGEQQPLSITTIVWVEVKVSYNAKPRFTEQQVFAEISERTPVGTSVHVIEASSQLAIRYEIKEGNVNNTFNIIPDSGGVVFTQKLLDYEMLPFYKLIIQAADLAGMVSNTILLVHLKDENDNAPIFTQVEFIGKISESTPPNSTILAEDTNPLVIRALDADSDANGRLVYRIVEPSVQNDFAVDSSTGVMRTLSNLDYEQRRFFQFTVQVHDMGTPHLFAQTTACVTIEVIDVNDCSPKFNKDLYETLVVVPTYKGVKVITVSATDGDAGKNSQLIFFISNGNIGNKFQIDPISGVISIQNPTKLLRQYQLTVNVSDGQFTSTVPVIINVKEKPESALRFNQDLYHATVRENSTEIKRLVVISTVDRNTNEPLFYSIVSPEERFQVGLTSGILSTTGIPFDREEQSSIVVVVKVSKGQEATEVAYVRVKITVEDVNDNAPIFVNLPYRALVKMDAAIGQAVRQVIAMDRDAGRNAQVHYRFQEQQEHFQISSSGEISLKKSFNQENLKTKFVVYVVAEDEGEPVLSSIAEVQISVVKKAVPVFEKSFYVVEIPENKQLHTSIVRIQASSFEGPQVVYTITKGDPSCHFSIGFHTGVIEVIQPLDYEMLPIYRLNVKATDSLTGTHASVFVDIILKDINDNSPMFTENVYTVSVSEASVVGTSVLQVLASDSDSGNNKALFYQLVEGSNYDSDFFQIDHKSGVILTTHMLDHEELRQHALKVRVVDGGIPALTADATVVIDVTDVNDNSPVFIQPLYNATVSELAPEDLVVAYVQALDADSSDFGRLEYSILCGNEDHTFEMDVKSGKIFVSSDQVLKMEPVYNLNISVSDGIFYSSVIIRVMVSGANVHSPSFSHADLVVELEENSPIGTFVTQISATDVDPGCYGQVTYFVINDFAKDKFSIRENGDIFTLQSFDRENTIEKIISIRVMAKDGGGKVGFCIIRVILSDINDHAPQFRAAEYKTILTSDVPKQTPVVKMVATDLDAGINADILYKIEANNTNVDKNFEIDPYSGVIVTKKSLIGLEGKLYTFYVRVADAGKPSKMSIAPVYISILGPDVPVPKFSEPHYRFSISEDLPVGTAIGIIQAESELPVIYSLVKSNIVEHKHKESFAIEFDTGVLKLEERVDHEISRWYLFTLQAQSNYKGKEIVSAVDIHIEVKDINDNSPQFDANPYKAFTMENLPGGTMVIQIKATDLDSGVNGHVTYSLDTQQENEDILDLFTIDSKTGWITTLKQLDREKQSSYTLAVAAVDGGEGVRLSATTKVEVTVVDMNDNPPRFTSSVYKVTVREGDSASSGPVAILGTTDVDTEHVNSPLSCYITGGDPGGLFALESSPFEWKVFVKKPLDREERDHYLLNITAIDGTYMAKATIEVKVLDANDNSPVFDKALYAVHVPEDVLSGQIILRVSAADADIGTNAQISYKLLGAGSEDFTINSSTGELKAACSLDREEKGFYRLLVEAMDEGGRLSQADIEITVEDINDNAPQFTSDTFSLTVSEKTEISTPVGRLQAVDLDVGLNGKIVYSLVDSADGWFSVDERSGIICLEKPLNKWVQDVYILVAQANDQGTRQEFSSTCQVTVFVQDVIKNSPVFHRREYTVNIPEDISVGTSILHVFALSRDSKENKIFYSIANDNEHVRFRIDSHTGDIFVTEHLDYEQSQEHFLIVEAANRGTPLLSSPTAITIILTDANDNSPTFSKDTYSTVVSWPTLTFGGKGYIKHRLLENEIKEVMKLSLRLKTFSSQATIMYFEGTGYNILEILHGRLQYIFDCGDASGVVSVHSLQVNDGKWHSVLLEMNRNYTALTLDQVHSASSTVPGIVCTLSLNHSVFFGGYVKQPGSRLHHVPYVSHGLQGCLAAVVLNGRELPLTSQSEGDLLNIMPGCSVTRPLACQSNPCANGGTCSTLPMGGYFCQCGGFFLGTHCEIDTSACASNPCRYGGTCIPAGNRFYCKCRGQHSGKRCAILPNCKDNPCKNNGTCIDSRNGPYCQCAHGFHGKRCIEDVDECTMNPCSNGGQCKNTYGSYKCSCSLGFKGRLCELKVEVHSELVSTSWGVGLEKVLGTVGFVVTILVLILMVILAHKKVSGCTKPKFEDHMQSGTSTLMQSPYFDTKISRNMYAVFPSQVPVQPICYTNTTPSGSYCNRHKYFFNPNSVHRHKPVAAHNTVPSMTSPPTSSSPLDSAFIQSLGCGCSYDGKLVPFDLPKKPLQDSSCQLSDTSEHLSEIRSTSSVQPESCDDSGYHWDTSDWMPSAPLPSLVLLSQFEEAKSPLSLHNNPAITKMDYFLGGRGIENDFPPTPDVVSLQDELSSVVDCSNQDNTLQPHQVALYHINELHALSDQRVLYDLYNPQIPNDGQNQHIQQEQHDQRSLHSNHALGD
ncbi:protocadherin Fat 1-like [Arapaima gigas]